MNRKIMLLFVSLCLTLGVTQNTVKMILKTGVIQLEKARNIVELYQERSEYLDALLDEVSCPYSDYKITASPRSR